MGHHPALSHKVKFVSSPFISHIGYVFTHCFRSFVFVLPMLAARQMPTDGFPLKKSTKISSFSSGSQRCSVWFSLWVNTWL
jgi:hypothetical protein